MRFARRGIYIYIGRKKKNRFRVVRNGKAHREHDTESTCIRAIYVTTQVDEPTSTVKEKKRKEGRKEENGRGGKRRKRKKKRRKARREEWQLTAIPTGSFRAPYSWTGLGSRRTQANNTSTAPTGSHKISRGSRDRVDVVCGPSHPGRALNERRVEGRKVEAAAEPRQLEFLRRKDRDREEEASLGSARPRVPLALFARSFRLSSLYLPRSRVAPRAHTHARTHARTHTHAYTILSRGHSGIELSSLPPPTAAGPPDTNARARQGRKDRRRNRNGRGRE